MATQTATAYAVPINFCALPGSTTTFDVQYNFLVQDGVQQPVNSIALFTYDATQNPAANLGAFKVSVAAEAALLGFTVDVSSILVFTAVN